jgi:hypothetical protein
MIQQRQQEVKKKTRDVKQTLKEKSEVLRLEKMYREAKKQQEE